MDIRPILISQYLASLAMLEQTIRACPESVWHDERDKNPFWQAAYHALFFIHEYLGEPGEPVSLWPKHRPGYEDFGLPPDAEPYDKEAILEYLEFCRRHVAERVPVVNLGWGADEEYTGLELQIYSIRHLMQHCGELMERLGSRTDAEIHWVGQVRDRAGNPFSTTERNP